MFACLGEILFRRGVSFFCRSLGRGEHLPFKRVFAFCPEVVHVGLEMQLEHVVFVDVLRLRGNGE